MENIKLNEYTGSYGLTSNPYQQIYSDTCAIKSQQIILKDFGINISEDQLIKYSTEHGWYNGNGTAMEDVGKILSDAGIPCTQTSCANAYDLANELAQGHKVIVAVDSGELWNNGVIDHAKDILIGDTPDHALIVAGLDMSDLNNPMVILTDPGTGQIAESYPLSQFMDAWSDSNNFMVSTNVPTPSAMNTFINNNIPDAHLPQVADVDFQNFQNFLAYSHTIDTSQLQLLNLAFHDYSNVLSTDFNESLINYGLPLQDFTQFIPNANLTNPLEFNYASLMNNEFASMATNADETKAHSIEVLNDLHNSALEHASQCMEDGMYISAHMWQDQANDAQNLIDNYENL